MNHAYLIMAHNEWDMMNKLIRALDYPGNDIYLHIDKRADLENINVYKPQYSNVFLQKRMKINWGGALTNKMCIDDVTKCQKKRV